MSRPLLEMADIVRCAGQAFVEHSRRWINWQHQKVLLAIARCRTAALGGHRDRCTGCGHTTAISYNSCRNRHCPRCQGNARLRWLKARERELLPNRYVHAVFTPPRELAPLALQNKRLIFHLLFHASAETLLEIPRDSRHLGAEVGFFSVLHSWNQRLRFHPHVHCVLAAGGLAPDHSRWISARRSFFLPIGVLSCVFRGKFVAGLRNAFHRGELQFHGELLPLAHPRAFAAWLRVLFRHDWVVYSKPPFGGPEHALRYLGAYTHRVAISNSRLVALSDGNVAFRWRDSTHGNKKRLMTLDVEEFLRRFLLHVLPPGFVRIRNFGFLANRNRATLLPLCSQLLGSSEKMTASEPSRSHEQTHPLWNCPVCGGTMHGSPRLNSCFAHHRNQTGALHESQSTASALARALARMQIPCLNWPGLVRYRSLQLPHDPSVRRFQPHFIHQSGRSYPLQRVHALTEHVRLHSKYIGFPVGGFLQVAVSEAPSQSACELEPLRAGAPDTALGLLRNDPGQSR